MKACISLAMLALLLSACDSKTADPELAADVGSTPATDEAHALDGVAPAAETSAPTDAASEDGMQSTTSHPSEITADDAAADKAVDDAIDNNLSDHERYKSVVALLKAGVAAGDASKVAALVHYPISVSIKGKDTVLKSQAEFVLHYQDLMTSDIRDAVTGTAYRDLFVNYKGVSFGRGQVWINGVCKDDACKQVDVKVVTIQHEPE